MLSVSSVADLADNGIDRIALSCGVFDGVHLGHQKILQQLIECAQQTNASPVVLSFDPHPRRFLQQSREPAMMYSQKHKERLLEKYGVHALVVLNFNKELASLSPEAFISLLTDSGPVVSAICVGSHWRFGSRASGDISLLHKLAAEHHFAVLPQNEALDGSSEKISSSTIRDFIRASDLMGAKRLLGRPYSFYGQVKKGRGIAAERYNYPTANLELHNELYPALGIYAVNVIDHADRQFKGVMYLGNSQTDYAAMPEKPFAEVHIFDFNENIYDQYLEVELLAFIREDCKYESEDILMRQIREDISAAREFHQL